MEYAERLESAAVLGAAGKMGSGIVLLTAMEMADLAKKPENRGRKFVLHAVDLDHKVLSGLMSYIRAQAVKAAEKRIVALRQVYADRKDLVENGEIVAAYANDVLDVIRPTTSLQAAAESQVVFEAAPENPELKIKILSTVAGEGTKKPWVLTNTSSIPIEELDAKAKLEGRIIGFHFYNPPAVQKLVEIIRSKTTVPELARFAQAYAKNLRKVVVPSNDVAGFIGNGHFMRDALHAVAEVERLSKDMPFVEAVYCVNKVSQDFLVRPMGIFQLVDYVGIDVCRFILDVMDSRLKGKNLKAPLVKKFLDLKVRGGQNHDGSQKDGFLRYEKGKPAGIYDPDKKAYVAFSEFQKKCDEVLGALPEGAVSWKGALRLKDKDKVFGPMFDKLASMKTLGADLARRYGARSREIGLELVSDGVAGKSEDVNTVLLTGFFHAYGPINDYFQSEAKIGS